MRQVLSTALVALIVGGLAGATVGALAQSPDEAEPGAGISPAAVSNINADRVDGKHAVGAGASVSKRAGKLVATNRAGYLPKNIINDEGVRAVRIIYQEGTSVSVPPGESRQTSAKCPPGSIALAGGFRQGGHSIRISQSNTYPNAVDTWFVSGFNTGTLVYGLVPYATCLEVTPSGGLTIATKGLKVAHAKKRGK